MLRPFPQYSTISSSVVRPRPVQLPGRCRRRSTAGSLAASPSRLGYTFSKELDNLLASTRNPFDYSLEKSRGAIDHRARVHRFLRLPIALRRRTPHRTRATRVARALVSRWTVSGLVSFTTGSPLALVGTACTSGRHSGHLHSQLQPRVQGQRPHQRQLRRRQPYRGHRHFVSGIGPRSSLPRHIPGATCRGPESTG